ncbi:MAG: hypothetical protein JO297_07990 [Nitrososphaeraceae archaeon]|nr:hypothetical protein [Nitrososphaeraceae archaeon]
MDSISEMSVFLLFLLSLPIVIQSSLVLVAYADKNHNKALINDIADQLLKNVDTTKAVTETQQQPIPPSAQLQQGQQLPWLASQQIQQNALSPSNNAAITTTTNATNMATTPTSTTTLGTQNPIPVSSIKITVGNPPPSTASSSQLSTTGVSWPSPPSLLQNTTNSILQAFNSNNIIGNNLHPVPELVANQDSLVTLDGNSSHSPDGKPISFSWTQISGPTVILSGTNTSKATFIAPRVYSSTIMFFKLTVMDTTGMSDSAIVKVTVIPTTTGTVPSRD